MLPHRHDRRLVFAILLLGSTAALAGEVPVTEILRASADGSGMEQVVSHADGLARRTVAVASPEGLFFDGWIPIPGLFPGIVMRRATVDGGGIEQVIDPPSVGGLFIDEINDKIYFTVDTDKDCVGCGDTRRADLDGSNIEIAAFFGECLGPVAVHVISGLMCVVSDCDPGSGIFCGAFNDENLQLISSELPDDMVIDQQAAKLYWTRPDGIRRMNLNGSGVEDLVTGLSGVSQLAIDPANNRMWWSVPDADKIQGATMDGTNVQDVITGADAPTGIAYLAEADKLYFIANPQVMDLNLPTDPVPAASRWGAVALVLVLLVTSTGLLLRKYGRV